MTTRIFSGFFLGVMLAGAVVAQTPASDTAPKRVVSIDPAARAAAMALKSPEVHPDRTVTFRYKDPNAKTVLLRLEGRADPIPLTRDEAGLWALTTEPLSPENYGYRLIVDGVALMDPMDGNIRPNLQNPSSVAPVPGTPAMLWERTDVPHGEITHHLYRSKKVNDNSQADRDLWVYTPPGYDQKRKDKYPVLYLLHGYSDDASGWWASGQANFILDNMIAQGKVKPMVIVMPLAYGTMDMIYKGWNVWTGDYALPIKNQEMFADQLIGEILPMAEARYNIARDPAHRAIAGLSMGGGHTLFIGLNHPDIFGYVGAMSSAVVTKDFDRFYAGRTKAPLKLFWMSCGTEDGLITVNRTLGAWAKTNVKGEVSVNETPGMHTWLVWRENLITLAPLLFTK
jgi:enterochelin esterase-like enzyme